MQRAAAGARLLLGLALLSLASAELCSTCKDITRKFEEGLKKTHKSNFGGGNTRWEEKSLGSFQFSETRLIEIIEGLCDDVGKECHTMVERYEEDIEDWWFKHFAKKKDTTLKQYLCMDKAAVCCPDGTFGVICQDCPGGRDHVCRGNGKCKGDGTREGKGGCRCDPGYKGKECEECAKKYYQLHRNVSHTQCEACHPSCGSGCSGPESKQCDDCAAGWDEQEEGCFDLNECEKSPCKSNEFCTNTEGSYECKVCHSTCGTCSGRTAESCLTCAPRHYMDPESNTCRPCHESCKSACADGSPESCDACKEGWVAGQAGCEDVDECEHDIECEDNSYCTNTPGSYKCVTCHPYCAGCTGSGGDKCKKCKDGYATDDNGFCKDVDECAPGLKCTGEREKCKNLPGTYRCECEEGFVRKDDECVLKPKEEEKPKESGKSDKKGGGKKSGGGKKKRGYRGPGSCSTCKDIVKNFHKGMDETDRRNFGGGNTKWEEEKLGKYMYSETRLTEILESVCENGGDKKKCYDMVEKSEEAIEKWWFDEYPENEEADLFTFLCIERIMICCFDGTYGAECKNCIGGRDRPCYGNGKCDGEGTRAGSGVCECDKGYGGYTCDECAPLNYTAHHNDTHIVCKGCDESCKTACFDTGAAGCEDCRDGWTFVQDKGCVDVNECDAEKWPCDDDQYCENLAGSFKCHECDEACNESCIGPGPGNCHKCADLYFLDEHKVCTACHKACKSSCTDGSALTCDACRSGWTAGDNNACIDVDECAEEPDRCPAGDYCLNTEGSASCKKCAAPCLTCRGPGEEDCDACAVGFERPEEGAPCRDVDECASGAAVCDGEGRECQNTAGAYSCRCRDGWQEDANKQCVQKAKGDKKKKGKSKKDKKPKEPEKKPSVGDGLSTEEMLEKMEKDLGEKIEL